MKKRFLPLVLALVLCLGMAVPAFAADEDALPEASPTLIAPENSGIILNEEIWSLRIVGFARSGSNDSHIAYGTYQPVEGDDFYDGWDEVYIPLVPKGMDIAVTGVSSADEVLLRAFSAADMEEGPWDLPGGTFLFFRLFTWESGKDVSLAPLDMDDPMGFEYDDPQDGTNLVAGTITAADAGFTVSKDGDMVIDSEWLYGLLDEGDLLMVTVGDYFWMYQLSGDPFLISDVFTDVDAGKWYTDPVAWARQEGIAAGTTSTSFSPNNDCTQAQILTFLYRAARGEGEATADDMAKAIAWAKEKGMIDDNFDGSTPCTRSTAVSYIWQAFGKPGAGASSFTDVDANADYAAAVSWAVEKGITGGTNTERTKFSPDDICTRGHIATFLYRAYN